MILFKDGSFAKQIRGIEIAHGCNIAAWKEYKLFNEQDKNISEDSSVLCIDCFDDLCYIIPMSSKFCTSMLLVEAVRKGTFVLKDDYYYIVRSEIAEELLYFDE